MRVGACETPPSPASVRSVWREAGGLFGRAAGPWNQTMVRVAGSGGGNSLSSGDEQQQQQQQADQPLEQLAPLTDPLIARCLAAWEAGGSPAGGLHGALLAGAQRLLDGGGGGTQRGEAAWLPTGALRLLDSLHAALPRHTLLAADFTQLPEVQVEGWGAPLVASTVRRGGVQRRAAAWDAWLAMGARARMGGLRPQTPNPPLHNPPPQHAAHPVLGQWVRARLARPDRARRERR